MSYYEDIYKQRLNRFGRDYQSRIQGQREKDFDNYLLRSVYRIDFLYNGVTRPATLEPYKQTYLDTYGYLLTKVGYTIPAGTILEIISANGDINYWMVWWLEKMEASGYNRYVVLKMTNQITWTVNDTVYTQWFYFVGPGYTKIADLIKETSGKSLYIDNTNKHLMVSKCNNQLNYGDYFEVTVNDTVSAFEVRERDTVTTPGVGYYSIEPVKVRQASEHKTNYTNPTAVERNWYNQIEE